MIWLFWYITSVYVVVLFAHRELKTQYLEIHRLQCRVTQLEKHK